MAAPSRGIVNPMTRQRMKSASRTHLSMRRRAWAEEELQLLTEECAEWLHDTLAGEGAPEPTPAERLEQTATFWDRLQDGVDLCRLIPHVTPKGMDVPARVNARAKAGNFFARENLATFLRACEQLGVPRMSLFDSEDVVEGRNRKGILNTILWLARFAARHGLVKPPLIVQMELEIEEEAKEAPGAEEEEEEEEEEEPEAEPEPEEPAGPRYLPYVPRAGDQLDETLAGVVNSNQIDVRIRRCKKRGEYKIGPRGRNPKVYLRLIRNLVIVRVGGGWEGIVSFARRKAAEFDDAGADKTAKNLDTFKPSLSMGKITVDGGRAEHETVRVVEE